MYLKSPWPHRRRPAPAPPPPPRPGRPRPAGPASAVMPALTDAHAIDDGDDVVDAIRCDDGQDGVLRDHAQKSGAALSGHWGDLGVCDTS